MKDLNNLKGTKILSLNLRSLLPKINMLHNDLVDVRFDAFAICESWLKPSVDTRFQLMIIRCLGVIDLH